MVALFGQLTMLSMSMIAQIGPLPAPSVVTIKSLSLPAADDSPELILRIYRLPRPQGKENQRPSADELVPLLRDLFDPPSWRAQGAYLQAIDNRLIVRQRADVHRHVRALLEELQLLERESLAR